MAALGFSQVWLDLVACRTMGVDVGSTMDGAHMRVWVEPPEGWGLTRAMLGRLRALGYTVEEHRVFGAVGYSILVITG